jgi:transposase-like protein
VKKRQYSDKGKAEILAVLDSNKGNVSLTARQTGVPRATLQEWRNGRISSDVPEIRQIKKEELSDVFERVARQYLDRALSDEATNDTKGKDAVIAAATATDKMQLLRGKPTAIVAESARNTVQDIVRQTGITEERARQIVAQQFGIAEAELISQEVM